MKLSVKLKKVILNTARCVSILVLLGMSVQSIAQNFGGFPGIYNNEPAYLKGLIKQDDLCVVKIWASSVKAVPGDTITFTYSVICPEGDNYISRYFFDGERIAPPSTQYKWKAMPGTHVFTVEARRNVSGKGKKQVFNEIVVEVSGWGGEFNHPGIYSSGKELNKIKANVNGNVPHRMKLGWENLIKSKYAGLDYTASPKELIRFKNTEEKKAFDNDGKAVYNHALQWVVTGEQIYADKAIEICNDWAATCKDIWTVDVYKNLHATNALIPWIAGAEIIRYYNNGTSGWPKEEISRFDGFVNILKRLSLGWKGFAGDPYRCQNQNAMVAEARMAIGIYQNDRSLFDSGYDLLINDSFGEKGIPNSGRIREIHGKPVNLIELSILKENGEILEINRDGGDLAHMNLVWWKLVGCAEILWHQGIDLYDMKFDGEKIPRLLKGAEWFNKGILQPPYKTHGVGDIMPRHQSCASIEQIYNSYHNRLGNKYPMPYTEELMKRRKLKGIANNETLTHADLSIDDVKAKSNKQRE